MVMIDYIESSQMPHIASLWFQVLLVSCFSNSSSGLVMLPMKQSALDSYM